ncbi:MAG: U32 family peptidase [Eubacteriaceae bacterium]
MRYFNNKEVELLAPAGNYAIFEKLIQSNCDAFYLGGKQFNMRMHRNNFNFSNSEIKTAIQLAHENNKKVYITVNNLMNDKEVSQCEEYLYYLEQLQPDALIIQDLSIIQLIYKNNLNLNMHSSVMMNVHNLEMINKLTSLGISRVVVSREIDLKTIKHWNSHTQMEFEYFIHGDMCSTHGSQCYYSNLIFNNSSNRGLCMKPCRWDYKIKYKGNYYNSEFPMAVKDMYMYENIPELINAGVSSFKIEGRMRDVDYLETIINAYGDSIDRYISDPIFYDRCKYSKELYENRKRDFSTAFAFGNPRLDFINRRYEGTGYFYSHGKVFSKPIAEHSIDERVIVKTKSTLKDHHICKLNNPLSLSVKADTLAQVKVAIKHNVEFIYINTENFTNNNELSMHNILKLNKVKNNCKLILSLPKMTFDDTFEKYDYVLSDKHFREIIDGIMVSNLGAFERYKDFNIPIYGDNTLNVMNNQSNKFYNDLGIKNTILSIEMNSNNLKNFMENNHNDNIEIIAHGSPTIMYMELDLYENLNKLKPLYPEDNKYFENDVMVLIDNEGYEHPIYKDTAGKNHLMLYKDICLLPLIPELTLLGVKIYRLEISHYNIKDYENIIRTYKKALTYPSNSIDIFKELNPNHMDFSFGSLHF